MPRPRRFRRVFGIPSINHFKPMGVPMAGLEVVVLSIGEYEAIRLVDLEGVDQTQTAEKMGISQPTLNRTLTSARNKIADALVNGKAIRIEGGNYQVYGRGRRGMSRGIGRGIGRRI